MANGLQPMQRVCVIRLDEIGDMVLMSPFFRELRRALPDAWITALVKPAVANLMETCPHVNEVLTVSQPMARGCRQAVTWLRLIAFAHRQLRPRRFAAVLLPRWGRDASPARHLALLSGAPRRVAYRQSTAPCFSARFVNEWLDSPALGHSVTKNLDFLRHLGIVPQDDRLETWLTSADRAMADKFIEGMPRRAPRIAVAACAIHPWKRWPENRFAEVVEELQRQRGAGFVLIGDQHDRSRLAGYPAFAEPGVLNLAGRTTLRQTAAILERCQLCIGNDSGPVHLAAAAGTPVVEVTPFPASDVSQDSPRCFHPWGVPFRILHPPSESKPSTEPAAPATARGMGSITPEQVLQATHALLKETLS